MILSCQLTAVLVGRESFHFVTIINAFDTTLCNIIWLISVRSVTIEMKLYLIPLNMYTKLYNNISFKINNIALQCYFVSK